MKEYEVVISGISGCFPGNLNLEGLRERLYDTKDDDIVTLDSKEFLKNKEHDQPEYIGAMKTDFDYTHFGLRALLLAGVDVNIITVLEKAYECIVDAGVCPLNLKGEKIAVVTSVGCVDSEMIIQNGYDSRYSILTSNKAMTANRISYYFDLKGSSYMVHGLTESGLTALDLGFRLVAKGHATGAIVAISHVIQLPEGLWHGGENQIPLLSPDGKTRSFSQNAAGYARSECAISFFLQRKEDAVRSYGKIEKCLLSTLEWPKEKKYIYGSSKLFLKQFYDNIDFDSEEIAYIEADGIGIPDLDREELGALLDSVCSQRRTSLPVSCCKTKLGHTSSCSGLVSLAYCILASQEGHIPPTLHYNPHEDLSHPANDPQIKIVTEKTPVKGRLYGVSSFGLGGLYGHVVISQNEKSRQPSDILGPQDPPALIFISGRDNYHMMESLIKFSNSCNDKGYVALIHKAFCKSNHLHTYKGYAITNSPVSVTPVVEINEFRSLPPVWFIFSGMGSQWIGMGTDLLKLPITADSLHRSHQILLSKGLDLISIITSSDPHIYDNIMNSFVGITAIQVALVDLMRALELKPDGIIGHSLGELACGYADGCLTAEQTILCGYARARASVESTLIRGMMAAIGKGFADLKDSLPDGIEVACHNSSTSCTISGPSEVVEKYVHELESQGVFARTVNVSNIAFHSKYVAPAGPLLLKYSKEVIVNPIERSKKWLCTSVEESLWDEAKMCSAEYYTNNLLNPVLFEEAAKHIPEGALVIEIAPHGLLQAIVKRSHPKCFHVPLTSRTAPNNLVHLLEAVGRLYFYGMDVDISSIYQKVSYPVPRETKSLTSLTSWNSDGNYIIREKSSLKSWIFEEQFSSKSNETITLRNNYIFEGKSVAPVPCILEKIIRIYGENKNLSENGFLEFKGVRVHSLLQLHEKRNVYLSLTLLNGGGDFYIVDIDDDLTLSGVCCEHLNENIFDVINESKKDLGNVCVIEQELIYSLLGSIGYQIEGPIKNIEQIELSSCGFIAKIRTHDKFQYLMNSMIMSVIFFKHFFGGRKNSLESIASILVKNVLPPAITENEYVSVYYSAATETVSCPGIVLSSIVLKNSGFLPSQLSITQKSFLPLQPAGKITADEFVYACSQIVIQNKPDDITKIVIVEVEENHIDRNKIDSYVASLNTQVQFKTVRKEALADLACSTEGENKYNSLVVIFHGNIPNEASELYRTSDKNYAVLLTDKSYPDVTLNSMECALECDIEVRKAYLLRKKKTVNLNESAVVNTCNNGWKRQVQQLIAFSRTVCYLVSHYNSYCEVMTECMKRWDSSQTQNLRLVFLNEGCPKFDLRSPFYKNHLEKGFKVNVCQASEWGYLLQLPTEILLTENNNHVVLDNIRSDLISLQCISVLLEENNILHQAVEYGGKTDNIRMIGVGTLEGEILKADPVLHWECPQEWTMEEACTVPLFYSMAYYMIEVIAALDKDSRVLILGGDSPAGEAAIRVAISTGASVFVTCSSQANMDAIKQLYPETKGSKVCVIPRKNFLVEIENSTSCEGFRLVLNFSPDKHTLMSSTNCMAERLQSSMHQRVYFQISKQPMKKNFRIGQGLFLRSVSLRSCEPEKILDLEYKMKVRVRECVEQGMKRGVVKPLKYMLLSRPVTRHQLTTQKIGSGFEKFILSSNEESKSSLVSVGKNKSNLLIGKGDVYLDIVFQLINESNKEVHLLYDESSTSCYHSKRINTVLHLNKYRKIHLHSYSVLDSAENCRTFLRNIQKDYQLEQAVIITQGLPEGVWKGLEEMETGCRVCLVGEEPEGWCQAQAQHGRSTVCLAPEASVHVSSLFSLVGHIYSSLPDVEGVYRVGSLVSKSGYKREVDELLPGDLSELLEFDHSFRDIVGFTEVPTKSSPYLTSTQASPVFLIPGFRRSQIIKLAQNLYCPAFIAAMPKQILGFDQLASQLNLYLTSNFHQMVYTIVCEGWSVLLAFKLAQLLETDGKECQIFSLGQSFSEIQDSLSEISMVKLNKKYFPLIRQDSRAIISTQELNDIQDCLYKILDIASIGCKISWGSVHHSAYVTHIRPFKNSEMFQAPDMEKLCKKRVIVHCVNTESVFESGDLAGIISDYTFHEIPAIAQRQNFYKQQEMNYFGQDLTAIKDIKSLI